MVHTRYIVIAFSMTLFFRCAMGQIKTAEKEFEQGQWYAAIDHFKKAYEKADQNSKGEVLFKVGCCYMKIFDYRQAEVWFSKAIKAKYADPIAYYYLAYCKKWLGKYAEALVEFEKYAIRVPIDKQHELFPGSCELAVKWMNEPLNYSCENMAQVNSKDQDILPFPVGDTCLFFVSNRDPYSGRSISKDDGERDAEMFITCVDRFGKWSSPQVLGDSVNSGFDETFFCLDTVSKLFCVSQKIPGKKKGTAFKEKIFYGRMGDPKAPSKIFGFEEGYDDREFTTPYLVGGGRSIIFSSDIPGGYGGFDLWISEWNDKVKDWGAPENLGPEVNSSANEKYPYLYEGQLYFSSDRDEGMGGYDIYVTTSVDRWGNIRNLQYPINTSHDDITIIFPENSNWGYISSNREGGKGGYDIYRFTKK
jgi:tetratricopeptide (TPR) repeat protein